MSPLNYQKKSDKSNSEQSANPNIPETQLGDEKVFCEAFKIMALMNSIELVKWLLLAILLHQVFPNLPGVTYTGTMKEALGITAFVCLTYKLMEILVFSSSLRNLLAGDVSVRIHNPTFNACFRVIASTLVTMAVCLNCPNTFELSAMNVVVFATAFTILNRLAQKFNAPSLNSLKEVKEKLDRIPG